MTSNLTLDFSKASVYGNVDGLSLQNMYYAANESFPNCKMFSCSFRMGDNYFKTSDILDELKSTLDMSQTQYIVYLTENLSNDECSLGFCMWLKDKNLFARIEKNIGESYILYSNENISEMEWLSGILKKHFVRPDDEKNNIYTISSSSMGYNLIKSNVKEVEDFDITKQYNDDLAKEDAKIHKFINEDDKSGLLILHGEKGTGKTTYIRHLINTYSNRKFVFVPASLINLLGEPSFSSFLLTLHNHVIILEDCENAIQDRKSCTSNASAVSLLLNMTDGLLSDDLGIKFICTFNEDVKNIDSALMRKGRLVSKYEFKNLVASKASALVNELYPDNDYIIPEKGMTLAEIYNIEDDSYEIKHKSII